MDLKVLVDKKSKIIIPIILLFTILFISSLISCTEKNSSKGPLKDNDSSVITLKFGHDMPVNSAQHISALRYADIVNFKSNGRVKIEIFPEQKLGTDQEMLELAQLGKIAIILPPTSKMTSLIPDLQLLDIPFLTDNREELYEILDGNIGESLLKQLNAFDLTGVTFWESGYKQFTSNKPIHTPMDFKGLNIRVMKSPLIMKQYQLFGANPIPIDFKSTYNALKDRVVDGQENPLVSISGMQFYKVQSNITISNHAYLAQAVVFSTKILNSLPKDIQTILLTTAKEITPFERNWIISKEEEQLNELKEFGIEVNTLTDEERQVFKAACKPLNEELTLSAKELYELIKKTLETKHNSKENEIIIGLNADLVASSSLSGQSIKRGMELAVNEINLSGGILGKKVRIVAMDNSGISARGIDNMHQLSKLDNLIAVFCGIYSPIALAELEVVHKKKIPLLDPWAAATAIVDNGYSPNYVFRVSVRDEFAGPFLVEKALEDYSKVALLLVNDGWGKGNHLSMIEALTKMKNKASAIEWFNWGEKDMNSQLDRIEESGAESIILVAGVSEGETIIKNMASRNKKLPIIAHWGITGGHFWKTVNRELNTVSLKFLQSYSFMNAKRPNEKKLIQSYFRTYNIDSPGKIFAPVGTAHAYDLVNILKLAIEKANSTEREKIRDALEKVNAYDGIVKYYAPPFTTTRHDALDKSSFFLAKYDNNGYIIPIKD